MAGIKIVDLPAVGRDLAATDLFEMSLAGGTGSRKITGQEIMNASKLSVNNTPVINGTAGRIFFQGSTNVLQQSAGLSWDDVNSKLILGPTGGSGIIAFPNTTSGFSPVIQSQFGGNSLLFLIGGRTFNLNGGGTITTNFNTTITGSTGTAALVVAQGNSAWSPVADFNGSSGTALRVNTNGNVLIGTTTDAGYKLDVNGSAIIRNTAQVIGSDNENVFTVSWGGSNSVSLGSNTANSPTLRLGSIRIAAHPGGSSLSFSNGFLTTVNGGTNTNSPITLAPYVTGTSTGNVVLLSSGARISAHRHQPTSGTLNMVMVGGAAANQYMDFSPSSGNAEFNQLNILNQINTTGTYSGIVRGLYYNPILTSVTGVNHRAIETTTGNVIFNGGNVGIGTSSPSAPLHIETSALTTALYINTGNDGGFTAQNNGALATNRTTQVRLANGNTLFGTNDRTYQLVNIGKSTTTADFYFQYWDGASYNERLRIFSSGNVSIGTSTDAGFKLDVNGTARVQGNITQSGANTAALGYITNGTLGVYSNAPATGLVGVLVGCVSNNGHTAIFTKGNSPNSTAIRITDQNVGASVNHLMVDYLGATGFGIANGTLQVNASAQVEIQSTTKGFLPPRMTQTQRNAIASPAIGLEIYQTDATEGKYIYKSSGWTYIG